MSREQFPNGCRVMIKNIHATEGQSEGFLGLVHWQGLIPPSKGGLQGVTYYGVEILKDAEKLPVEFGAGDGRWRGKGTHHFKVIMGRGIFVTKDKLKVKLKKARSLQKWTDSHYENLDIQNKVKWSMGTGTLEMRDRLVDGAEVRWVKDGESGQGVIKTERDGEYQISWDDGFEFDWFKEDEIELLDAAKMFQLYINDVESWKEVDVTQWAAALGKPFTSKKYAKGFRTSDVDGPALLEMTDERLKAIFPEDQEHRLRVLMHRIIALRDLPRRRRTPKGRRSANGVPAAAAAPMEAPATIERSGERSTGQSLKTQEARQELAEQMQTIERSGERSTGQSLKNPEEQQAVAAAVAETLAEEQSREIAELRAKIAAMDTDGDGVVSAAELAAAEKAAQTQSEIDQWKAKIAALDTNGDGIIDEEEMKALGGDVFEAANAAPKKDYDRTKLAASGSFRKVTLINGNEVETACESGRSLVALDDEDQEFEEQPEEEQPDDDAF